MEKKRELTGLCEGDKCWAGRNQKKKKKKKETELLALDEVEWSKLISRREVGVSRELQHDKERKEERKKFKREIWRLDTNWDQIGHWGRGGGR